MDTKQEQTQFGVRISKQVKRAVDAICKTRGLKVNRFVEEALLDKLEELEDIEDIKHIRFEKTYSFEEVINELKRDGKL